MNEIRRDYAGALGCAENAIEYAIKFIDLQDYSNARRVLDSSLRRIAKICPLDDMR